MDIVFSTTGKYGQENKFSKKREEAQDKITDISAAEIGVDNRFKKGYLIIKGTKKIIASSFRDQLPIEKGLLSGYSLTQIYDYDLEPNIITWIIF